MGLPAVAALTGAGAPAAAQSSPTLAGTWRFDPGRSAEERKAETGNVAAGRGMVRDPTRGGGGGGSDVRPSGAERIPVAGGGERAAGGGLAGLGPMASFARPQPQLVIVQTDSTVALSLPNGVTEVYRLDGRREKIEVPGGEPIETSARWKSGKLTIERKFGSTGSVREVYSLAADGRELMLEVRITGAEIPQPIDQKRVYGRVQPKS
jgi:L-aminopeptidase/D-esterase-like protein